MSAYKLEVSRQQEMQQALKDADDGDEEDSKAKVFCMMLKVWGV